VPCPPAAPRLGAEFSVRERGPGGQTFARIRERSACRNLRRALPGGVRE